MAAHTDPTLYLYTSLTAGSSHIITATSRLETILKANKIPFRAVDCATDEKARMLWGRRSKGRKLPGLVKFAQIVGDLEQIEEWNEYGELKDQIASLQDDFGPMPTAAAATLAPNPPAIPTAATPLKSDPPSRASSETRHISISEPSDKEKEKDASDAGSKKPSETPMNVAIRQLGAEAAAKAGQKKAAAMEAAKAKAKAESTSASAASAAAVPAKEPAASEETPTTAVSKLSTDAAAEDPTVATEVTAGKAPSRLAAEGARRTSVDKIATADAESAVVTSPPGTDPPSTEAQVLELRRSSSITNQKSHLSVSTPAADSDTVLSEPSSATAAKEAEATAPPTARRQHRGSDIGEATKEEIAAIEKKLSIPEEEDDDEEDDDDDDEDDDDDDEEDDEDEDEEADDKEKGKAKPEDKPATTEDGKEATSSDTAEKAPAEASKTAVPPESKATGADAT